MLSRLSRGERLEEEDDPGEDKKKNIIENGVVVF